ncbi:MAG: MFS transporter [Anaerolineales bacterium]|nr:MFS transporter [Anaerolineae bacterium]PWB54617.1 MAG: MFS transporter [Anaerolineales bacterium]
MIQLDNPKRSVYLSRILRGITSLTFLFLIIEFFDELNYSVGNAALPALRNDLRLTYVQVGMLLGLPSMINTFIEPVLMLVGDTRYRKHIMLGGGLAITCSLLVIACTHSFVLVLIGFIIAFPASGAFVSLSQATLMDLNPRREPHMMARWTLAGSIANLVGPLILAAGLALGYGWRWAYFGLAFFCLVLVVLTWLRHIPMPHLIRLDQPVARPIKDILSGLWVSIRNPMLMRWLILVQFSDLLLDVLTGYLALYFTDVMGFTPAQASLMFSILMGAGLVSNIVLIPLLERVPGRSLVRLSAAVTGILYAAWLILPWLWAKIGLIILIRLVTLGWYEVLQGEAFASTPGRSGTVMAINSVVGLLGGGIAFLIGWVAARAGLQAALWILLAGPISLVLFVPRTILTKHAPQEPPH